MPRTCIICGKRAGSREHTFPAALGGRRTNKGIYCGMHNQGFSPLASIITDQLKVINALLAVRPDHRDRAEPFQYTSSGRRAMVIFNGTIRSAAPMRSPANGAITFSSALAGQRGSGPSLISPCRSLRTTSRTMRDMAGSMTSRPLYKGIARTHSFGGSGRRQQQCCRPIRSLRPHHRRDDLGNARGHLIRLLIP